MISSILKVRYGIGRLRADCKWSHNLKIQFTFAEKSLGNEGLQSDSPYHGHLTKSFTNYPPEYANLIDSHVSLHSSHRCKLNTFEWVVEVTYLHVVIKCESLLGTI